MARREPDLRAKGLGPGRPAKALVALAVASGLLVLYAGFVETERVTLERVEIGLPGLPRDLAGLRILLVSDLESRGRGRREEKVAAIGASAGADLVVITGDLVSKMARGPARRRAVKDVADLLCGIPSRLGSWFVEGHGEHFAGRQRGELIEALQACGVRFLQDDVAPVPIGGATLALVGIALHPAGREGFFWQRPDGSFVQTRAGRAETYLNFEAQGAAGMRDYDVTGSFRFSREEAGIGVTFYNRMPEGMDRFYRMLRTETGGVMRLSPHGTVFSRGRTASGVAPSPGPWNAFRIRVQTGDGGTQVKARIWLEGDREPERWPIDCVDATPTRLLSGTVGLWAAGPGEKEFRRLGVVGHDGSVRVAEGRGAGGAWKPPVAPDYMLALLEKLPAGSYPLALAHSPDVFPYTAALGWPLLLAGHTQGGQIRLPVIGALSTDTVLGRRYAAGLFERGGSSLYITRGVGTTRVPFRFLTPPEVTLITLRAAGRPETPAEGAGS